MKHPIIIKGQSFDWKAGAEAARHCTYEDGNPNWGALMMADPGCMSCPKCDCYLWAEGVVVRCPDCGHKWRCVPRRFPWPRWLWLLRARMRVRRGLGWIKWHRTRAKCVDHGICGGWVLRSRKRIYCDQCWLTIGGGPDPV